MMSPSKFGYQLSAVSAQLRRAKIVILSKAKTEALHSVQGKLRIFASAVKRRFFGEERLRMTTVFLVLLLPGTLLAQGTMDLFSTVPNQDSTYSKLSQMANAGLLEKGEVSAPLTRYDVAQLLLKAQAKYSEIIVAQADMEIPPPPEEGAAAAASSTSNQAVSTDTASPSGAPVTEADDDASLAKAAENLHSLQEVYQSELSRVKDRLKALSDKVNEADAEQYGLRKRIKGITQFPSISVHGIGRAFGYSIQRWGNLPSYIINPGGRETVGYLDISPQGTIGKEVSWTSVFRLGSTFEPNELPALTVRKVSMNFNPSWMSATIGDFEEAYTPLMLWNRNSLDLAWAPESWARMDERLKYESYFDHEPYWPLRGLKMGTDLMWPDSDILKEFKTSVFAHMIRSGFNEITGGGWYYGPNLYTDWAFGGTAGIKSQRMYLGGMSAELSVDTYGLMLLDAMDSQPPGTTYGLYNPATWARKYTIGSVKPDLKVGLGGDFYFGGVMEYAFSSFQDDQTNSQRVTNDFALLGGPYLQFGDSKISFNYLNVGPYFYSPLAQARQDNITDLSNLSALSTLSTPDLFAPVLRNQFVLNNVPRAGGIYTFYDRTQDNTFPYGTGTPNRQGGGVEIDVKTLKEKALKIKGSAYLVQEISGNLVMNGSGTGYIPVDTPALTTLVPVRNFVYINAGPSFNLGPFVGLDRPIEIGGNVRFEQTTSVLGTLTSTWLMGGVRVAILPVWEVSGAFSNQDVSGSDAGYNGTLWARYPYIFDNSDLGKYGVFTVKGSVQSLRFSSAIKVNKNSVINVDWDWTTGNLHPVNPAQGTMNNQFMELSYEVKF